MNLCTVCATYVRIRSILFVAQIPLTKLLNNTFKETHSTAESSYGNKQQPVFEKVRWQSPPLPGRFRRTEDYRAEKSHCTWLLEMSSCSCLTFLHRVVQLNLIQEMEVSYRLFDRYLSIFNVISVYQIEYQMMNPVGPPCTSAGFRTKCT